MHTIRRTASAVLVALVLMTVAGLGVFRHLRTDAQGATASTSLLDAPIVPTWCPAKRSASWPAGVPASSLLSSGEA